MQSKPTERRNVIVYIVCLIITCLLSIVDTQTFVFIQTCMYWSKTQYMEWSLDVISLDIRKLTQIHIWVFKYVIKWSITVFLYLWYRLKLVHIDFYTHKSVEDSFNSNYYDINVSTVVNIKIMTVSQVKVKYTM